MSTVAIEVLQSLLPEHGVALQPRPDGTYLLTVSQNETPVFIKAIERALIANEDAARELAFDIIRDQKLVSGEVRWKGAGARWVRRQLPTFTGAPVNPTAAKQMWTRRNLDHRQRPTA